LRIAISANISGPLPSTAASSVSAAICHSGYLSFALGNACMYSPASRKLRSIKPSGVVIGTWKARDQDIIDSPSRSRAADSN
jgi:hypothetical protein